MFASIRGIQLSSGLVLKTTPTQMHNIVITHSVVGVAVIIVHVHYLSSDQSSLRLLLDDRLLLSHLPIWDAVGYSN